jgi:hypothetical protein
MTLLIPILRRLCSLIWSTLTSPMVFIYRKIILPAWEVIKNIWNYPVVWLFLSMLGMYGLLQLHHGNITLPRVSPVRLYEHCNDALHAMQTVLDAKTQQIMSFVRPAKAAADATMDVLLQRPLEVLISPVFGGVCTISFLAAAYCSRKYARDLQLNETEKVALTVRLSRSIVRVLFTVVTSGAACLWLDHWLSNLFVKYIGAPLAIVYVVGGVVSFVNEARTWRMTHARLTEMRGARRTHRVGTSGVGTPAAATQSGRRNVGRNESKQQGELKEEQQWEKKEEQKEESKKEEEAPLVCCFAADECCICLEKFAPPVQVGFQALPKGLAVVRCGHVFHDACLAEWFGTAQTCPLCREATTMLGIVRQKIY